MTEHISIEGLNSYEQAALAGAFADADLSGMVTFNQPLRDPGRPGGLEMLSALVEFRDPALAVVAAWILKTRRKVTKIKKPDGTVVEYRQESFISGTVAEVIKALKNLF